MEEQLPRAGAPIRRDLWGDAMHDLRQPLQSLLLLTRVVAGSDDPAARDKGARYMEASLLSLQSMLELLGRLSRLQSGAAVLVPERCDLAARISALEPELAALAGLAGRGLHVSPRGGILSCDASLLTAIIRGMVGCAARYGSGDIELGCEEGSNGGRMVCSVPAQSDTAPRRDVFIDLAGGSLSETPFDPVPGLALIVTMAKAAGQRLELNAATDHRLVLTLEAAV